MADTGYQDVAAALPGRRRNGRYFWQGFAERLEDRLGGLPGQQEGSLFVDECLRAGAMAVPLLEQNSLWEQDAPDISEKRDRGVYELRIRLGLFYAASLRYLVQGVTRMRVTCGESEWRPVSEGGGSFRDFAARQDGKVDVTWSKMAPDFGWACLVTQLFVPAEEALLLTPELAREVYEHVCSAGPSGLFGMMLASDGQVETAEVDVARVFLQALGEAVSQKVLRVNTEMGGHLFVTPAFWFLTSPIGLNCVNDFIRSRRGQRRYNFTRHEIFKALREGGYLVGTLEDEDTPRCVLKPRGRRKPLELRGLCIAAGVLFSAHDVPFFEGTLTLMEEQIHGGSERQVRQADGTGA